MTAVYAYSALMLATPLTDSRCTSTDLLLMTNLRCCKTPYGMDFTSTTQTRRVLKKKRGINWSAIAGNICFLGRQPCSSDETALFVAPWRSNMPPPLCPERRSSLWELISEGETAIIKHPHYPSHNREIRQPKSRYFLVVNRLGKQGSGAVYHALSRHKCFRCVDKSTASSTVLPRHGDTVGHGGRGCYFTHR